MGKSAAKKKVRHRHNVAAQHQCLEGQISDDTISQTTGRLELADKGTLFLHEITRVPLDLQPKLLRVVRSGEFELRGSTRRIRVNVRWIASSRHDLAERELHRFRGDLYDRLNAARIEVPSLRERREDIPCW